MIDYLQLVDNLSTGIAVIDRSMTVLFWNAWLEEHSGIPREQILNQKLTEKFPELKRKGFVWKAGTVFKLGNFSFFSRRQHQYLFPFENAKSLGSNLRYMQQDIVLIPLKAPDQTVTSICVSIFDVTDTTYYEQQLMESKRAVEELSRIDELTRINNRRNFMARLNEELARRRRLGGELSFIMIDVDHFKRVNDTKGHLCGDYVLRTLAELLKGQLRDYDIIGRYGGEEFGVFLPNTDLSGASIAAERLRCTVEKHNFEFEGNVFQVTISQGLVDTSIISEATSHSLIKAADECLYAAKQRGRNCVVPYHELPQ